MNKRLNLSPPYLCGNERKYVLEAFEQNWIAPLGPNVTAFEREMAAYVCVRAAVATCSGTAAIHLALRWFGVGPGDTVFCSDVTFAGSCNAIKYQYSLPVFIDSEPDSMNMSPDALRRAMEWAQEQGQLPKAVIIVDLYGQSADYDALLPICREYGVPVIEDAAEALGATYKGRRCGSFGDIGIFSFNGNKIVNSSGGGMAVSDDEAAVEKMLFWATQAREKELHYEHKEFGYNYRLSNLSAGVGRGQLECLGQKMARRREIYHDYERLFEGAPLEMMPLYGAGEPNWWLSVAVLAPGAKATPHEICVALNEDNIEARPAWKPMHMQPVFADCPFFPHGGGDGVGGELFLRGICLPSGEAMTREQQECVAEIVRGAVT